MKMLEIAALENGAHRNQTFHGTLPDGWAVVPEDMELENFPFGEVTAEEVTHYRDKQVLRDVTKTRDIPVVDEDGNHVLDEDGNPVMTTEEYTEQEWVTEQEPYGVMTVTGWEPLPMPEPAPKPEPEPSANDVLNALLGVSV
ncbi:MAG: hypothetical protein J6S05_05400 [Bacteroidaceae bacterium]|nr:hypothetical protein [Bacteroidaceae bacterium]